MWTGGGGSVWEFWGVVVEDLGIFQGSVSKR